MIMNWLRCFGLNCWVEESSTSTPTAASPSNPTAPGTSTSAAPATSTAAAPSNLTVAGTERGKSKYWFSLNKNKQGPSIQLARDARRLNISLDTFTGSAQAFTFKELEDATQNFNPDRLLGEGGFGQVYKGYLHKRKQEVAVKKLDFTGEQGILEFVTEVKTLDIANHQNIIKLIGYCAENDERLLVYEFMPLGSLDSHLFDHKPGTQPLDWNTRKKIIHGIADGLIYLHDNFNHSIIHYDLKSSNILLDWGYHVKLSDFGLAKLGPSGDEPYVNTTIMQSRRDMLNLMTRMSDIYSFGVVLLELITGRKAYDETKPSPEQRLAHWARSLLRNENNIPKLIDPSLGRQDSKVVLRPYLVLAGSCIHAYHIRIHKLDPLVTTASLLKIVDEGQSNGV